jgi:hypothetical protein
MSILKHDDARLVHVDVINSYQGWMLRQMHALRDRGLGTLYVEESCPKRVSKKSNILKDVSFFYVEAHTSKEGLAYHLSFFELLPDRLCDYAGLSKISYSINMHRLASV